MEKDTEPHIWPRWKLSPEETAKFFRGNAQVTVAVDESQKLLGVVYHAPPTMSKEELQTKLAQMHSNFPDAITREGSMRGHYFCEDLPDAGWAGVGWPKEWAEKPHTPPPSPQPSSPDRGHDRKRDIDFDR